MKLFFDTEFTGLHKGTSLISIGIVSESGKKFYAELTDFDDTQCDSWIEKNVLEHLMLNGEMKEESFDDLNTTYIFGDKATVRDELLLWLDELTADFTDSGEYFQFVSDVCHYDMVLLLDLLNEQSAMQIPELVNPCCHDISQDIAMILDISEKTAFDYSREQLLTDRGIDLPNGKKHNALYDAEVIKAIYDDFFETVKEGGNG